MGPFKGHLITSRKTEILLGLVLFIVASALLWDAFDNRGKKVPWPGGAILPW